MKFTEEKLEHSFIELLKNENYIHQLGNSIARNNEEVLIEADLFQYLMTKYASKGLSESEAKSIILQLKSLPASDLYESNKTIMRWLSDGFILKREDRNQKDIHIELIDYVDLEKHLASSNLDIVLADPEYPYIKSNNIYKNVNQLEIVGNESS